MGLNVLQQLEIVRSSFNARSRAMLEVAYPNSNIFECYKQVKSTRRIDGGFAATLTLLGAIMRFVHPDSLISELDLIPTAVPQKTGMNSRLDPQPQPLYQMPYLTSSFQQPMDPSFEKQVEDIIETQKTMPSFRLAQLEGYPSDDENDSPAASNGLPSDPLPSRKRRRQATHFTHKKRRKIEEVKPDGIHLLAAAPHHVRFPLITAACSQNAKQVLRSVVCHRVAHGIILPAVGLVVDEGSCTLRVAVSWANGLEKNNVVTFFKEYQIPFDMSSSLDVAALVAFLQRSPFPSSSPCEPVSYFQGLSWRYDHKWHVTRPTEGFVESWVKVNSRCFEPLDTNAPEFLKPMDIDEESHPECPWPNSAQDLTTDAFPSIWYYRPAIIPWMASHRAVPAPFPATLVTNSSRLSSTAPVLLLQDIFRTRFDGLTPQLSAESGFSKMEPVLPPFEIGNSPAVDRLLQKCFQASCTMSMLAQVALSDASNAAIEKPVLLTVWNYLFAHLLSQSEMSEIKVLHKAKITLPCESRDLSNPVTNNGGNLESEIRSLNKEDLFGAKQTVAEVLRDWNLDYSAESSEDWRTEVNFYFDLQEKGPDPVFSFADSIFSILYNMDNEDLQEKIANAHRLKSTHPPSSLWEDHRNWLMDIPESGPLHIPFLLIQHQKHDNFARYEQRMHLTAVVTHLHVIHEIDSLPVFGLTTEGSVISVVAAWWDESSGRVLIVDHGAPKFDIAKPEEALAFMGVMAQLLLAYAPQFASRVNKSADGLRPPSPPGSDSPEPSVKDKSESDEEDE